jgi:hypothetical protein
MNNQPEGIRNMRNHIAISEDPHLNGAVGEKFVPRTLLDYLEPRATDARDPIRFPRLTGEPPSYGVSTINILQNNFYHGLEHEDPHDDIQALPVVFESSLSKQSVKGLHQVSHFFPFTLKDKVKRWLNSLSKDSIGT